MAAVGATCPRCARPVAAAQPRCVYCGAELPAEAVAAARGRARRPGGGMRPAARHRAAVTSGADEAPAPPRACSSWTSRARTRPRWPRALGLSAFEASQRRRRGGLDLHRILPAAEAAEEAERLAGQGLDVLEIAEDEVRRAAAGPGHAAAPRRRGALALDGRRRAAPPRGRRTSCWSCAGPIAREYQTRPEARRQRRPATLEPGYRSTCTGAGRPRPRRAGPRRLRLRRRRRPRRSSLLQLAAWLDRLCRARAARTTPSAASCRPALGRARRAARGAAACAAARSAARRGAAASGARGARQRRAVPLLLRLARPRALRGAPPRANRARTPVLPFGRGMKLIVQIPCLNEEATLPETLAAIPRSIPGVDARGGAGHRRRLHRRAPREVARAHGADHIVRFTRRKGLAAGFMAGLDACVRLGADVIVNTDADNQYPGSEIPRLIAPILAGEADMVVGDRGVGRRRALLLDQAAPADAGLVGGAQGLGHRTCPTPPAASAPSTARPPCASTS